MDQFEVIVVGAGAVGLAVARALALAGREVIVVEKNSLVGQETSSRNSGVIHSGIYYPHDSLKARLCVRGRELLYEYCAKRNIAHRKVGKLILAQEDQLEALQALRAKGTANGVPDVQLLSAAQVRDREPLVRCAAGLFLPCTGIVDAHEYIMCLWADLEAAHGIVVFDSELSHASPAGDGLLVTVSSGSEASRLKCRWLINSAGLFAPELLTRVEGYPSRLLKSAHFAKGSYFVFRGGKPFRHLVYPMPSEAGLGIHATLDLNGATRFGPDVEWVSECNYAVDANRAGAFYRAVQQYWPGIPPNSLEPDYSGIRPKLVGAEAPAADFVVENDSTHQITGLINLLGIESPGLTASLAIAEHVTSMMSRE